MRRVRRLTAGALVIGGLAGLVACGGALSACGGARPTGAPPPPPPDAAVDATARPAADDCGRVLEHLFRLRGQSSPPTDAERLAFVEDCTAQSTAAAVACVLAAPDLNALALCEQNPPREAP